MTVRCPKNSSSVPGINAFVERWLRRQEALGQCDLTISGVLSATWHLLSVIVSAALAYLKLLLNLLALDVDDIESDHCLPASFKSL